MDTNEMNKTNHKNIAKCRRAAINFRKRKLNIYNTKTMMRNCSLQKKETKSVSKWAKSQ